MRDYDENIVQLIQLYLTGDLSEEEKVKLEDWIHGDSSRKRLFDEICEERNVARDLEVYERVNKESAWEKVVCRGNIKLQHSSRRLGWYRWVAAVMLPLLLCGTLWLSLREKKEVLVAKVTPEIEAGTAHAVLLMGQGERIDLSMTSGDTVLNKGDVRIRFDSSKSVTYEQVVGTPAKVEYNTIIVPRKGDYQLILADGSKVYLNSESRLRFPTHFEGKERRVYLEGEGYFKVAKDTTKPFVVETKEVDVRVLGTSFNVNAYASERAVRTTLVSGKVQVSNRTGKEVAVLNPGQQTVWQGGCFSTQEVDALAFTAWIDGKFYFEEGATLKKITEQLQRWYDLDFIFSSERGKQFVFAGMIKKEYTANEIFSMIEKTTRVKFNVRGRTIIVSELDKYN